LAQEFFNFGFVTFKFIGMKFLIIHLPEQVYQFFVKHRAFFKILKCNLHAAYIYNFGIHVYLAVHGCGSVNVVKGILLQDDEIDELGFPVTDVVIQGNAVVSQDIDLFVSLLSTPYVVLTFQDLMSSQVRPFPYSTS